MDDLKYKIGQEVYIAENYPNYSIVIGYDGDKYLIKLDICEDDFVKKYEHHIFNSCDDPKLFREVIRELKKSVYLLKKEIDNKKPWYKKIIK